jgi:hypothetical protein
VVEFKIIKELAECKKLWEQFSPNEQVFDVWNYRVCFYEPEFHELYFIVAFNSTKKNDMKEDDLKGDDIKEDTILGVLPLWKHKNYDYYEWFGGQLPEHNSFFVKNKELIPLFLEFMPKNAWLPYLKTEYKEDLPYFIEETSYFVDLKKYEYNLDNYFSTFNKKHRKNLNRDLRILSEKNPVVVYDDLGDFDRMIELNNKRFSGDSFFADSDFINGFLKLAKLAKERNELEMISIHIDGKCEAAELAVLHKGVYTVLLGGNNLEISNIGKLLIIEHLKNAITKKAYIVDFLVDDCGWKKLWNMDEIKWVEFDKEKKPD